MAMNTGVFIVCYRPKGALNCEAINYGPFTDYMAAEDYLATLPAAKDCEHKYIDELCSPDYVPQNAHVMAFAIQVRNDPLYAAIIQSKDVCYDY